MIILEFLELSAKELTEVNGGFGVFVAGIIIGLLVAEMLDKDANADFEEGRQAFRDSH